ncbi:phosphatidylinositol-glycan-specific phospholipase D-like isoform X3 [Xenopus laevis]|uniref:Phosphatidylinositol-glycan-specific phospholipase D n=1 Tax=Xenopus laevis TaxID=8355 RepID=A0A8J1KZT6_XENLA|nr:phosphatidylinositol-glycan-specific phospholipase D-like isoform X3 [Xenopus laevis]
MINISKINTVFLFELIIVFNAITNVTDIYKCVIPTAHRALEFFNQIEGNVNYRELLQKHPEAYQAGKCHEVSEDSHWTPFLKTSINYIREVYPQPWDKSAQRLVAFLFGIASHMVSDVSWHSLNIDQGFLKAMGEVDFYGSYAEAHQTGDFGGDVLSRYELNFDYLEAKWYIPVKDLFNIYNLYYGKTIIEENTITHCTYILFLEMYGESLGIDKLHSTYASKSPFLVERFQEYFLGGVDDMAYWSTNIFHLISFMLDNGTSDCYLPENPIFIQCNTERREKNIKLRKHWQKNEFDGDFTPSVMRADGADNITVDSGVVFQMNSWAKGSVLFVSNVMDAMNMNFTVQYPNHITSPSTSYFVSSPYARLGWAMVTADLNGDGHGDLVVGAPGYSTLGHVQIGRVFIVYGLASGLPPAKMDLDKDADVVLEGYENSGRFGSSLAVLDFNLDGHLDVAVGAPSVGSQYLRYTVRLNSDNPSRGTQSVGKAYGFYPPPPKDVTFVVHGDTVSITFCFSGAFCGIDRSE